MSAEDIDFPVPPAWNWPEYIERAGDPYVWVEDSFFDPTSERMLPAYLYSLGRQISLPIPSEDLDRAKADPRLYLAERLQVSVNRVEGWIEWEKSKRRCWATKKDGQPCKGSPFASAYGITPVNFDPKTTPYCHAHKSPEKRNVFRVKGKSNTAGISRARFQLAKPVRRRGLVYLIHALDTPRYKIGKTTVIDIRAETLNRQSPYPVEIVALIPSEDITTDEGALHQRYAAYRVHGEWFELPPEAVEEIKDMQEEAKGA